MIATKPASKKRLGAYYTPPDIADFLASWAIRSSSDRVLDPACGDAVFLQSAAKRLVGLGASWTTKDDVVGFEVDSQAACLAADAADAATVVHADFFNVEPTPTFQAVIGNPPYIRYHYFEQYRTDALRRAAEVGVELTRLTSSWAPFLVHASRFLTRDGRLAFVLPAELLSTDYAAPVRSWLLRRFASVDVLTFEKRVFPGAMVDVVLLMAEGDGPGALRLTRVTSLEQLTDLQLDGPWQTAEVAKWTGRLLDSSTRDSLEAAATSMVRLGAIASVDIGIVTGANHFFAIPQSRVREFRLPQRYLRRVIGRGSHLASHCFTESDWNSLRSKEDAVWLLSPGAGKLHASVGRYIRQGEAQNVHHSYKCRIRDPWWQLKLPEPPDLILSYMSNHAPRLVMNAAGVLTTNLLHNVRLRTTDVNAESLALAWLNSATLLSAELVGRTYGGGVLKLETREAERVLIPTLDDNQRKELLRRSSAIDAMLQVGHVEAAADLVDAVILQRMTPQERHHLRGGWIDLKSRRRRRAVAARTPGTGDSP